MGKESGDSKHFCPIMRCRVNLSLDIDNLSFHNKTMPFEGPTASKYWKEKNSNVPEYSVVHKESVDSENFCPIGALGIQNLSFPKIPMPQNIGRKKPQMFPNILWCTKRV